MDVSICLSAKKVSDFDYAILTACMVQSEERLEQKLPASAMLRFPAEPSRFRRESDHCLVISYDGGWYPFLDSTTGYNRCPQRWYIQRDVSWVIERIAEEMRTRVPRGRPGGRVFLHSCGVLFETNRTLLTWTLEKPSNYLTARVLVSRRRA